MTDLNPCRGCGGTGDHWDKTKNEWGAGDCPDCDGDGLAEKQFEVDYGPLQIFPKHPDADAYYVNGSYTPWAIVGRGKRFSDAELAAEWHHIDRVRGTAYMMQGNLNEPERSEYAESLRLEHETISRFAQLPHFDEETG